jgi:hypothetical protein
MLPVCPCIRLLAPSPISPVNVNFAQSPFPKSAPKTPTSSISFQIDNDKQAPFPRACAPAPSPRKIPYFGFSIRRRAVAHESSLVEHVVHRGNSRSMIPANILKIGAVGLLICLFGVGPRRSASDVGPRKVHRGKPGPLAHGTALPGGAAPAPPSVIGGGGDAGTAWLQGWGWRRPFPARTLAHGPMLAPQIAPPPPGPLWTVLHSTRGGNATTTRRPLLPL